MKFLIFGSNGKSGHVVATYLSEQEHEVTCFEKPMYSNYRTVDGDIYNRELIKDVIVSGSFDTVIYCHSVINNFAEEDKEAAVYVNAYMPHLLAEITNRLQTKVITISTDCVFSGNKGKYSETDFKDGESFYARTKALGELWDEKNFTIRTSMIGPDINRDGIGLINWFMKQSGKISGYTRAMWTGITTLELAKIIEYAAGQSVSGLENMVPDHIISKYELLTLFNNNFKDGTLEINSNSDYAVDKSLVRVNKKLDYHVPDYEAMLQELAQWIHCHKEYYPHYYGK